MSGGFFTTNQSGAFKRQMSRLNATRDSVYQNAMERYKVILERGEQAKLRFIEQKAKEIEDMRRKQEEQDERRREVMTHHRTTLLRQAKEKVKQK
jgi:hypothetical protein